MRSPKLVVAACSVVAAFACPLVAQASAIDDARRLLEQKKYDEVDEALKKLLSGRGPAKGERAQAMRISMDAALESGRVMTAQRRVSALLAARQTPELLYLGGRVAARAGEPNLAVTRFLAFSRATSGKSEQLRVALTYLMRNGTHPAEFRKYVRLFGVDGAAWRFGTAMTGRMLSEGEPGKAVDVAAAMLPRLKDAARVNHLIYVFRNALDRRQLHTSDGMTNERLLEACLSVKAADTGNLRYLISRCVNSVEAEKRVTLLRKLYATYDEPFGWDINSRFIAMRDIESEDSRLSAGRAFLAMENRFARSESRSEYEQFMTVIEECAKVFALEGRELVSKSEITAKFDTLKEKYRKSYGTLNRHIKRIGDNYLRGDNAARTRFYQKHEDVLDSDRLATLLYLTKGEDLVRMLRTATSGRSYAHQIGVAYRAMEWHERRKDATALLDAARDYMSAHPGNFHHQHVYDRIVKTSVLSVDQKVGLLEEIARRGGHSKPLASMVKRVQKDGDRNARALREGATFKAFVGEFGSKRPGTDLAMRTHVQLHTMKENRRNPSPDVAKLVKAFLDKHAKPVPGSGDATATRDDVLALGIFDMHLRHVWDNRNAMYECAKMWGPRLGAGGKFDGLAKRTRELGGSGALYSLAKRYVQVTKGAGGSRETWNNLREAVNPKSDTTPVFSGNYKALGWGNAIHYLKRQEGPLGAPRVLDELSELVATRGFKFGSPSQAADLAYWIYQKAERGAEPPAALAHALLEYLTAYGDRTGIYYAWHEARLYGMFLRSKRGGEAARLLQKHLAAISTRGEAQKASAIGALTEFIPHEGNDGFKEGRRRHTEVAYLAPVFDKLGPADRPALTVYDRVAEDMLNALRDFPEDDKRSARSLLRSMGRALIDGARFEGRSDILRGFVSGQLRAALGALKGGATGRETWDEIGELAFLNARVMGGERDWNRAFSSHIQPVADQLEKAGAKELAYAFVNEIERRNSPDGATAKKIALLKSKLAQGIPNMLAVDKSDPTYDLHVAAQELAKGNESRAWELTSRKLTLLTKEWVNLDANYVAWTVEQMRKQKMLKEALELSFTMLVREFELTPETAARVSLAKGDIYRDMQNYQAARIEYEGLKNNKRYNKTPSGSKAKYRLIDLLILTKDYVAAEGILERLVDSDDIRVQAEAYYLYAKMAFDQSEYKEAKDYLTEAFKRVHDHMEGRLLEGELKLLLPRGLASTEVLVGNPKLRTVAIPGRPLTLKLHDTNLSIARGGSAIPVIVTTSVGRDREAVRLFPSSGEKFLFTGTITTTLGNAKPDNLQLELVGDDTVSYAIDPEFQKANEIDYPPKHLSVKADARLAASAGEILSEEEAEKRRLEERLARRGGQEQSRRFAGRTGKTVRPGSFVYVQVTDLDRDVGDGLDTVGVDLKTSSGDTLRGFELRETEAHTGVFRGKVPTGIPFPKALASDTEEGTSPASLISKRKNGVWSSLADAQKPKWVEVDTMTSHAVSEVSIELPEARKINEIVLLGSLEDEMEPVCAYPEGAFGGAGLKGEYYTGRNFGKRARVRVDRSIDFSSKKMRSIHKKMHPENICVRWTGTVEPRYSEQYTFYTRSDDGVRLWIDGKKLIDNWSDHGVTEDKGRVRLEAGRTYPIKLEWYQGGGDWDIQLLWSSKKTRKGIIPTGALSPGDEVAAARERLAATMRRGGTGFTATLAEPKRYRKLRWVFRSFEGNAVSASRITVKDDKGTEVIPVETDFTAGTTNQTLEIAPGDRIEVAYNDVKRTSPEKPILRAELNSSYYNGTVSVANEVIETQGDKRVIRYQQSVRCRVGDQLTVVVEDYDEDLTDGRDTIPVTIITSGGAKLRVDALETRADATEQRQHAHAGVFMAIVKTGEATGGDTIRLRSGESLRASYLDKENTRPGVPVERAYTVGEAGSDDPRLLVYRTSVEMVEDKSTAAEAKLKRMKLRGEKVDDLKILKPQIIARSVENEPPAAGAMMSASVNAPLVVELSYPSMALNSGSTVTATAVAASELKAAQVEGREPASVEVPFYVKSAGGVARDHGYDVRVVAERQRGNEDMLEAGRFAGVVRLQLGSPGDPVDDLVVTPSTEFTEARQRVTEGYGSRVPTLLVSGSDVVSITVKNDRTGEDVITNVRLMSTARMELLDSTYAASTEAIHLGARFYVRLTDFDRDASAERDTVTVNMRSSSGGTHTLKLTETLPHAGVFTGSVKPEFKGDVPGAGGGVFAVEFGDEVTFAYTDETSLAADAPRDVVVKGKIHHGFDGELASFTKRFKDPEMAVKTRFLMAEALFEMAKEHRKIGHKEEAEEEIATGKRVLEEAIRDYPNTSLVAQGDFLLANLAQELGKYQEAIARYSNIISNWPDSDFAPRSQFKKAICLEKMKNYDQACEEYVRLTYVYPDNGLVADATVRLGNYYYKQKAYKVASRIFFRFQQKHPTHPLAAKALFLSALSDMKMEEYIEATKKYTALIEEYTEDKTVRAEAMYWLGDAYFRAKVYDKAYQSFKKLTWDYPESKWAKIARGRLTEDVLANQEE